MIRHPIPEGERRIDRPYPHYQPNDPPYNPDPVVGWIIGNTFGHEEEHLSWFEGSLC